MKVNYKKWSSLIGCFLIHSTLGSFFTFGNLSPYLASYLREVTGSSVRYSTLSWIATSLLICLNAFTTLTGLFCTKFRPKLVIVTFIGCLLLTISISVSYFTVQKSFGLTVLTYGCLNGISVGIAFLGPLEIAMKWFPKSKGLASSFVLFGYAGSGLVFNQLQTRYINPDNISPDLSYSPQQKNEKYFSKSHMDLLERVPLFFLILSAVILPMQIIGCLLMFENKPLQLNSNQEESLNEDESDTQPLIPVIRVSKINSLGVNYVDSTDGLSLRQLIHMPIFYLFIIMNFSANQAALNVITYYKNFGQTFISDDDFLSTIGSISNLLNAIGRLFWGRLLDKLPYKCVHLTILSIIISFVLTIYLIQFFSYSINVVKAFYFIWVCIINFAVGGIFVTIPAGVSKCFGQKNFTSIFGVVSSFNIPILLITQLVNTEIQKIGWFWYFIIGCGLSLIGYVSGFFFNIKQENGNDL